jgi:hypothetical protein
LTARRGDGQTTLFDWVAALAALTVAAVILTHGPWISVAARRASALTQTQPRDPG